METQNPVRTQSITEDGWIEEMNESPIQGDRLDAVHIPPSDPENAERTRTDIKAAFESLECRLPDSSEREEQHVSGSEDSGRVRQPRRRQLRGSMMNKFRRALIWLADNRREIEKIIDDAFALIAILAMIIGSTFVFIMIRNMLD